VSDSFPTPNISEILESLGTSKVFSSLDAAQAYHNIPIEKKSRPLTAFATAFGLFHFARLPFGLKNAGAAYCRLVQKMIDMLGVEGILAYLDDLLIHSRDAETHLGLLRLVFLAHREAGIKLNASKTSLFRSEVEYLGHVVNSDGIKLMPSYVQKIIDWPLPNTGKELSSFLGFTGYYREFLPGFAEITAEMNAVKNKRKIDWSEKMKLNFRLLKEMFVNAPCRAAPDFKPTAQPFILTIDFSKTAVGAVLSQEQNNVERFLGVKGRKCRPYEANYHSSKGEMLALVYGLTKYNHLLRLRKFVVITDSNTVLHWSTMKDTGGTIRRWLDFIQQFDFTVVHRAGKYNTNADLISRAKHMDEPNPSTEGSITQGKEDIYPLPWMSVNKSHYLPPSCTGKICSIVPIPWYLGTNKGEEGRGPPLIAPVKGNILIDSIDLEKAQKEDGALQMVSTWFDENTGKIQEDKIDKTEFDSVHTDVLQLYKVRKQLRLLTTANNVRLVFLLEDEFESDPIHRLVVPPSHRYQAIGAVHVKEHWGVQRTTEQVKLKFYWPGWRKDTAVYVTECPGCLHREQVDLKNVETFENRALNVNDVLCMDLVGPLTISSNKNKYILTLLDMFSRYAVAVPIPDKSAKTVATSILKCWIAVFGTPLSIRTDQGSEFKNSTIVSMMSNLNVKIKMNTPYNHQSNPIERFHRTLWSLLKASKINGENDWEKGLSTVILAYNATQHSSTNHSPARLFLGRELNLPHLSLLPKFQKEVLNTEPQSLEEELDNIITEMRRSDAVRIRRQFLSYKQPGEKIEVGDKVYAAVLPPMGNTRKLQLQWSGPLLVTKIINPAMLEITEIHGKKPRAYLAHRSKLRLARRNGEKDIDPTFILPRLPPEIMKELQLDEELSTLELPKLPSVIDEFHNSLIDHGGQDIQSSTDSTMSRKNEDIQDETSSTDSTISRKNEVAETEFNEHFNQEDTQEEEELHSAAQQSRKNLEPEPEKTVEEDPWILRRNSLVEPSRSTSSKSSKEKIAKPEPKKSQITRKETCQLHISESSGPESRESSRERSKDSSGSESRKSVRTSKPVERFDPSPVKLHRKLSLPSIRPSIEPSPFRMPRSPRRTVGQSIRQVLKEAWQDKPKSNIPASFKKRSSSRDSTASTRTRAASLEKLQTGSIKIVGKTESRGRSRSRSGDRSDRTKWEQAQWTDNEDEGEKGKERGGINAIKGKMSMLAKAKDTVRLAAGEGKWIPIVCEIDHRKQNDYFVPVLLNTVIERNLLASKFSPQAGISRTPAIYVINSNNNNIFVQVKRGETLGKLLRLTAGETGIRGQPPEADTCYACSPNLRRVGPKNPGEAVQENEQWGDSSVN